MPRIYKVTIPAEVVKAAADDGIGLQILVREPEDGMGVTADFRPGPEMLGIRVWIPMPASVERVD